MSSGFRITRRRALQAGTGAAALVLAPPGIGLAQAAGVTLRQGTNICAAVAPDGRIAFDLVNAIWLLEAGGGRARKLTDELQDATQPDFSPDGRSLVFQSYRDGNFHLWTMAADGSGLRQLTAGPDDHREPKFSPDGRFLAFSSDRAGGYQVFTMDLGSGVIRQVTRDRADVSMPNWSPDGSALVYVAGETAIERVEIASGQVSTLVEGEAELFGPSVAPDGRLAHVRLDGTRRDLVVDGRAVTEGEDVFGFAPRWTGPDELLYTADGAVRRRVLSGGRTDVPFAAAVPVLGSRDYRRRRPGVRGPNVTGIASPVCSRDGGRIAFRALNALWVLPIGQEPRKVVSDGYFASDPDFSPDGRFLLYSSDRTGTAELWLHELATGAERRITDVEGAAITPRFAPDGKRIAYQDQDGATWVADLDGGAPRQVTSPMFQPGRPDFSPDGRTLVLAAVKPYAARVREGTSQIVRVDVDTGTLEYTEVLPFRSLATRGDDGPVWSPDGRHLAFVVESTAWIVPVDAAGAFTGTPRQVTTELTDSLSWRSPWTCGGIPRAPARTRWSGSARCGTGWRPNCAATSTSCWRGSGSPRSCPPRTGARRSRRAS
ncbi:hypothetical protein QFW96_04160 [Saccharopolyspora sp. TS4A08]|uniref:Amidohydrolase n=1 Tax=Saccharopolyspora ipomoeae TaxID=3042027 RepID=A0ABT6PIF6_9PSEU|nr:hypothetical protein [Saccharopolyspora sp. TS4A08]MDI2027786.1 hypothetical protein [Saccharopolyspora sp. TS4A08]